MSNPLTPSQPTESFSLEEVVAFLRGERPLDGLNYGEREPGRPTFWWRKHLMAALAAHNAEVQRRVVEAELRLARAITTDRGDAYFQGVPLYRYVEQLEVHLSQPKEPGGGEGA